MTPGPISEQTDPLDLEAQTNTGRPALSAVSGGEPSTPSPDAGGVKMDGSKHPGRSDVIPLNRGEPPNTFMNFLPRCEMSNFRVGQKVVCISKKKMSCANSDALRYAAPQPTYGVVYTIRAINVWPEHTLLRFEEINNSHMVPRFGKIEPGFNAKFFRPVVARKTSIEVFQRILDNVNEGVSA